jgi:hypothetical protein
MDLLTIPAAVFALGTGAAYKIWRHQIPNTAQRCAASALAGSILTIWTGGVVIVATRNLPTYAKLHQLAHRTGWNMVIPVRYAYYEGGANTVQGVACIGCDAVYGDAEDPQPASPASRALSQSTAENIYSRRIWSNRPGWETDRENNEVRLLHLQNREDPHHQAVDAMLRAEGFAPLGSVLSAADRYRTPYIDPTTRIL